MFAQQKQIAGRHFNRSPKNHFILHNISWLEASLLFSFSLPSTLLMCVIKLILKVSCSHCNLCTLSFYFVFVFILFYGMSVATITLLVPVLPLVGFCCLHTSVADYWLCQVNKQKWNSLFSLKQSCSSLFFPLIQLLNVQQVSGG